MFDIMVKVANGEGWDTAIKTSIPDRKREEVPKGTKEEQKEEDLVSDDDEENGEKGATEQDNAKNASEQAGDTNAQAGNVENPTENNGGENQKAE